MDQYTIKILQTQRLPFTTIKRVLQDQEIQHPPMILELLLLPPSTLLLQAPIQKESSLLKEVSKIKLPKYLKYKRSMNTKSS
nr:hypothetical protein CFP56_26806 [Quercus suber]